MAYCPRCGVEVEDRLDLCPLCDTPIPDAVRDHPEIPGDFPDDVILPKPLYRKLTLVRKRILIASLIVLLGFFPIALTAGLDLLRNGMITWSWYVMVSIGGAAAVAWIFVHYGRSPLVSVTGAMLIVLGVQFLIAGWGVPAAVGGPVFSAGSALSSPVFPFFLAAFAAAELLLLYIVLRKPRVLDLLAFIFADGAALAFAVDMLSSGGVLRSENMFSLERTGWSLTAAAVLLPIALYFFYVRRAKKKGLNLAGFFFLDLMIMLLAIDYTTSGSLSWSLLTALIFLVIAAVFYLLHGVLYNDTDWKKALHL